MGGTTRDDLRAGGAGGRRPVQPWTDACAAIGDITLDSADDCDRPPVLVSGRRQPGEACTRTLECAGPGLVPPGVLRRRELRPGQHDLDRQRGLRPARAPDVDRRRSSATRCRRSRASAAWTSSSAPQGCTGTAHLENILLSGTPGSYEAWVENFNGAAAGDATIEVFVGGKPRAITPATVSVPGATRAARRRSPSRCPDRRRDFECALEATRASALPDRPRPPKAGEGRGEGPTLTRPGQPLRQT